MTELKMNPTEKTFEERKKQEEIDRLRELPMKRRDDRALDLASRAFDGAQALLQIAGESGISEVDFTFRDAIFVSALARIEERLDFGAAVTEGVVDVLDDLIATLKKENSSV